MNRRRNVVTLFSPAGDFDLRPGAVNRGVSQIVTLITIELSPAQSCRLADFELRTGMKIEAAILSFLDDELFNIAPAPAREQSTSSAE